MSSSGVPMNWHESAGRDEVAAALANAIAGDLRAALSVRGSATLAVSGGSTPRPLFEALSRQELDWARVSITQVDERWVPEDHPDSNSHLIRECLLRGLAAEANFVSMKTAGDDVFAAEAECRQRLSAFSGGADVVVLGMGDDGHTASFFPAAETLHLALDPDSSSLCLGLRPPLAPHDRMTLSLAVILRSRHVYLHVTGESKRLVLDRAREEGPETELPIRAVLRRFPELEIYFAA